MFARVSSSIRRMSKAAGTVAALTRSSGGAHMQRWWLTTIAAARE